VLTVLLFQRLNAFGALLVTGLCEMALSVRGEGLT
jgi:hypothetical protein